MRLSTLIIIFNSLVFLPKLVYSQDYLPIKVKIPLQNNQGSMVKVGLLNNTLNLDTVRDYPNNLNYSWIVETDSIINNPEITLEFQTNSGPPAFSQNNDDVILVYKYSNENNINYLSFNKQNDAINNSIKVSTNENFVLNTNPILFSIINKYSQSPINVEIDYYLPIKVYLESNQTATTFSVGVSGMDKTFDTTLASVFSIWTIKTNNNVTDCYFTPQWNNFVESKNFSSNRNSAVILTKKEGEENWNLPLNNSFNIVQGSNPYSLKSNRFNNILTNIEQKVIVTQTNNILNNDLFSDIYTPLKVKVPINSQAVFLRTGVSPNITISDGITKETMNGVKVTWDIKSDITINNLYVSPYWENILETQNLTENRGEALVIYRNSSSGEWQKNIRKRVELVSGSNPFTVSGSFDFTQDSTYQIGITHYNTSIVNPLPVELISFEAIPINDDVFLDWSTAWEKNNESFDIEMATSDYHFMNIGNVNGNGTTNEISNYSFKHENAKQLNENVLFYRLKQMDFDGGFEYSDIKSVRFNHYNQIKHILNYIYYQNGYPFYHLSSNNEEVYNFKILNVNGQEIYNSIKMLGLVKI